MTNRSMIRNGKAGVFQISDRRYVSLRKIKGSPCFLAEECYPCDDAPSGWYSSGWPTYIEAPSEFAAAMQFLGLCKAGSVQLLA